MERLFSSGVVVALSFAKTYALGVGNAHMARTDALLCYDMVKTRITRMLMGRDDLFYALIID